MGRIIFLSAVAYLAYRYIARSNKRHQQIAAGIQALPPVPRESAALAPAAPKVLEQRSVAAEPDAA